MNPILYRFFTCSERSCVTIGPYRSPQVTPSSPVPRDEVLRTRDLCVYSVPHIWLLSKIRMVIPNHCSPGSFSARTCRGRKYSTIPRQNSGGHEPPTVELNLSIPHGRMRLSVNHHSDDCVDPPTEHSANTYGLRRYLILLEPNVALYFVGHPDQSSDRDCITSSSFGDRVGDNSTALDRQMLVIVIVANPTPDKHLVRLHLLHFSLHSYGRRP